MCRSIVNDTIIVMDFINSQGTVFTPLKVQNVKIFYIIADSNELHPKLYIWM